MIGPGTRVGPYRLRDLLGRGGMGVVHRAVEERTGRIVAVKTVNRTHESILTLYRREIHALSLVSHPGIVRIIDEGIEDETPWYAMELVDGVSLRTFAEQTGSRGRRDALSAMRMLCSPLALLHGEGLVHRDLKPDNILVRPDGSPVLLDFGLVSRFGGVRNREALEVAGAEVGTIAYSSPEQALGELADARSDLYSLGCILYEIATGRPPFVGSLMRVVSGHVAEIPLAPSAIAPGVERALDALVLRLLAKEPRDRLGHADDVASSLASLGAEDWKVAVPRPRPYLYRPGFAGREAHMAWFAGRLDSLGRGSGGLVFVGGESGAGKTRFAIEATRAAAECGVRAVAGGALPESTHLGRGAPLGALREPLRTVADRCRDRGPRETARVLGANARVLVPFLPVVEGLPGIAELPEPVELPPDAARLRLFAVVADAFAAVAEDDPLLVVLDDLQWADELTLGFLEYVARTDRFAHRRVLLLGLHRVEEPGDALRRVLDTTGIDSRALDRLDAHAVSSIVGDMLALDATPPALGEFLLRSSSGNPFFVAEYLRTAVEEGLLRRDAVGRWRVAAADGAADFASLGLPTSLSALAERRLADLSDEATRLASAIAVFGREAAADDARLVAGLDERSSFEAAAELHRRHVLDVEAREALRFSHDSLRERCYDAIEEAERPALHRRAAEVLERARTTGHDVLARHWYAAEEPERARWHFRDAAREARDRFALAEAERHYRSCIETFRGDETEECAEVIAELAHDVVRVQGRGYEAAELLERALPVVRRDASAEVIAATARRLGIVEWEIGRVDDARRHLEEAIAIARAQHDRANEAEALDALANVVADQGLLDEARALYSEALELHRSSHHRRGEGTTLANLAALEYHLGNFDVAESLCAEAIEIHREVDNRRFEAMTTVHLAILRHMRGEPDAARDLFERARTIQRDIGDRRNEGITLQNLGVGLARQQLLAESRDALEQALAIHAEVGNVRYQAITLHEVASVERRLGRYRDAESRLADAERTFQTLGDEMSLAKCACERGHLALARRASGRPYLESARTIFRSIQARQGSDLGTAVELLEESVDAFERGETLVHGEALRA